MTTSILCHKLIICKLIDTVDETKCLDELQLLRDELKYGSLNRLLIKMIFDAQDTSSGNSLVIIEKYVHQIGAKDANSKQISPGKIQLKDKNDSKNRTIFPFMLHFERATSNWRLVSVSNPKKLTTGSNITAAGVVMYAFNHV